ncbi:MAG: class I poly(R)-hydroxyalkanoic acid synthase [Actinomycetota bacterium]|nr:class I poly(R)-hydroxyalkanoic acid synthase [Actinomycetota bacterium]
MDNPEAQESAAQAAEALAPEAGLVAALDPVSFFDAFFQVGMGVARNPKNALHAGMRYFAATTAAAYTSAARWWGASLPNVVEPAPSDKRFRDPAWRENPWFSYVHQNYLLRSRLLQDLINDSGVDDATAAKARMLAGMMTDALSPANFLLTNPVALKKAFDTGGASVARGFRNFLDDVANNEGLPRKVDPTAFKVGESLAATPGKVVFRNNLMELIQYEAQTEKTFEIPLLCSPPWINKYYIMDLAPGRSYIEWAVQHGHTVFAISYRNPDESMRAVTLDDYLLSGPIQALQVMQDITGADQVNVVGLCLGGSLTAMLLAYLATTGDDRVRSMSLLNTLLDFSEPGMLGSFTDPRTIARMESKMRSKGFLEARDMAVTFDLLRANDLIYNYVASNWLMGQDPPAFDILAWNSDSTRMPAAMHSFYLRSCYLKNELANGEMELAGTRLRLDELTQDVYIVAAVNDHITPWKGSYKTTHLLKSDVRFVLTSSGHIAGVVNPPSPKAKHWTNEQLPPDPETWLQGATEHQGSWWEDWTKWIDARAGKKRTPPSMGSDDYPVMGYAPGRYVLEH